MAKKRVPRVSQNAPFLPSKQAHALSSLGANYQPPFFALMGMVLPYLGTKIRWNSDQYPHFHTHATFLAGKWHKSSPPLTPLTPNSLIYMHKCYIHVYKVRLHRHICLWGASERKLGESLKPNQKGTRTNQGKRARHSATKEATPYISGWSGKVFKRVGPSSYWGGKTSWRCCVRRLTRCSCVQFSEMQNVFLFLNRVPVTYPELIRPSVLVMTHSLDQKVMARKAKARKCTAEIVGNIARSEGR